MAIFKQILRPLGRLWFHSLSAPGGGILAVLLCLGLVANSSADLIVRYTFDTDTGNTANDSATAGGTTNATITGGGFVTDPQRGKVLSMTGTGTNANFATLAVTSTTQNYTFAAWYKGTDSGYLFDQQTDRLVLSVEASANGLAAYNNATWRSSAATTANDNNWNHVAWVFQGGLTGNLSIYLNGVAQDVDLVTAGLQTQLAIGPIPNLAGTQRLFARYADIGPADSFQLTGLIDDYRIYDNALSASEIAALAVPPPETTPPVITGLNPQGLAAAPSANLVATFSENIALTGGGTITLTDTSDGSGTRVINLPDSQVTISASGLVIDPAVNLEFGTNYEVGISSGAVRDLASTPNAFAGTTAGQWTFTTAPTSNITYIDADNTAGTGNTALDGSGSFGPTTSSTVEAADNLWSIRQRPAVNGGGILAANFEENATPRLATTFTLPGPGLYTIYGYFWNNGSGAGVWDAQFKLGTVRPAVIHDKTTAENLGTTPNHFTVPTVAVNDGALVLCEAVLGTWNTATEGLTVTLYTDDPETGGEPGNIEDRTWFDGVGHSVSTLNLTVGVDSDGDGLDNFSEVNTHGTDPTLADTDGDSYLDGVEITNGSNPLLPDVPPLPPGLPADAIRIQTDGAWSWFSDHTARFVNGDLYVGYVKGQAEKMAMTRYDFDTSTAHEFLFSTGTNPSKDDHDVPNVTVLPDGKILSVYSRHNVEPKFFYRRSLNGNPSTLADWEPEQTRDLGTAKNTYSNTIRLSAESDKIYHFSRNINFNPTIHTSTDDGQTWSDPVHFIKTGIGGTRPYPRYATNHESRIDLIYTDGHPRNDDNSIYHLFYQGGNFRKSDGSVVKSLANLPLDHTTGERGTVVYPYTTTAWGAGQGPDDWIPNGRAWTWDIHYQPDGKPVCVFQVQVDGVTGPATDFKNDRIYYYYARWDGSQWHRKFIANGGRGLYTPEDDYGGGMCIDPENTNVIYISSNAVNPFDLSNLAPALNPNNEIYELYRGTTADGGATWTWETITANSNASNMRPFVPGDHARSEAVVWFRGRYTTYTNYDCDIYGIFSAPPAPGLRMRNVQWTPGGAAFKWASTPGKSYRIRASQDLLSFPIDVATGISAQGDTTYQPFTFPPAVSGSPKAFFRVEEE